MDRHTRMTSAVAALTLLSLTVVGQAPASATHPDFDTSAGIYRIAYVDGTTVNVNQDNHTHGGATGNKDRVDLGGDSDGALIVAAASGIIRGLVDKHGDYNGLGDGLAADGTQQFGGGDDSLENSCQDDGDADTVVKGRCQDHNNYVWIQHANGEWSKYTHFETGSVTAQGWAVGDTILVGQVLGSEGDVGSASGDHLHWEVAVPDDPTDPTPFGANGGFIQGENVAAQICDIGGSGVYEQGNQHVAAPCVNTAPTADAGPDVVVNEGQIAQLDGSGSSDPHNAILSYSWSPAGDLTNASTATPTYQTVDDEVRVFELTVSDVGGDVTPATALTDTDEVTVTVLNVAPTVTAVGDSIDEGEEATVSATFTDPGVLDTHTATVDWGDGSPLAAVGVGALAAGVTHTYGDDGVFPVTVTVTDDDGGVGQDETTVTVGNVAPTLDLDLTGAVLLNGLPTIIGSVGEPVDLAARGTDPGSDDLTFGWAFGDGSSALSTWLVNPPAADPPMSASVQPRDVTDTQSPTYAEACVYTASVDLADDDGGTHGPQEVQVLITGAPTTARNEGYWHAQFHERVAGKPVKAGDVTATQLACYLQIVTAASTVFDEVRGPLATFMDGHGVFHSTGGPTTPQAKLDERLLTAWLNFANGAYGLDDLVADTDNDHVDDLSFADAVGMAEAARGDATSTRAQLKAVEEILKQVNRPRP